MAQTPGLAAPERLHDNNDSNHTTTYDDTWDTSHFADAPGEPPMLWPCWAWGLSVWGHMADQWRVGGMGKVIGLDITALPVVEERIGVPTAERPQAYTALRAFAWAQQARWRELDDERRQ